MVHIMWAGKPLLWHIYPQDDGAHHAKLAAWLNAMQASAGVHAAHRAWNSDTPCDMPPIDVPEWQTWAQTARTALLTQPCLADQLLAFVAEKTQ